MTAMVRSFECFPSSVVSRWFGDTELEPDHAACPGGHTTPGVLGGWRCPCECHRQALGEVTP